VPTSVEFIFFDCIRYSLTISQDLIRISVGTEHIDDIIADFEQSFKSAAAIKTSGGEEENATVTGSTDGQAKLVV
jgi:O-acetylhomoserine/O-acetylserine sulfhydrylase